MGIIIILQRKNCSDDLVLFLEKKLKNVNEKYQVSVNMQYGDYYKYIFK